MARVQNGFKCSRFSLEVFSLFDNSGFSLQLCESARHTRRNGANFRNTVISSVQWCMVLGSQITQLGLWKQNPNKRHFWWGKAVNL